MTYDQLLAPRPRIIPSTVIRAYPVPRITHLRWSAGGNAVKTSILIIRPSTLYFARYVGIEGVVTVVSHVPTKAYPTTPFPIRHACIPTDPITFHQTIGARTHQWNPTRPLTITSLPLHRLTDIIGRLQIYLTTCYVIKARPTHIYTQ